MNKKQFEKAMNGLLQAHKQVNTQGKALGTLFPDSCIVPVISPAFDALVELLKHVSGDYLGLIDIYIIECDFGRKDPQLKIDGKDYLLKTPSDVWEAIKENQND